MNRHDRRARLADARRLQNRVRVDLTDPLLGRLVDAMGQNPSFDPVNRLVYFDLSDDLKAKLVAKYGSMEAVYAKVMQVTEAVNG